MRIFFACIFVLTITSSGFSQDKAIEKAEKLMAKYQFEKAAVHLEKIHPNVPTDIEIKELLVTCYENMGNTAMATEWQGQIIKVPGASPNHIYKYADLLKQSGNYDEAFNYYTLYMQRSENAAKNERLKKDLQKLRNLIGNESTGYDIWSLNINSSGDDFGASWWNEKLVFTSNGNNPGALTTKDAHTNSSFYDLHFALPVNEKDLGKRQTLDGNFPNKNLHDGPAVFAPNGTEIFVTTNFYKEKNRENVRNLQIQTASYNASKHKWVNIHSLPFCNPEFSVGHPSISQDGKYLYFMADLPGGYGGTDIYVSKRNGRMWSAPVNLGSAVNTEGDEQFPFISADNTLYFASNGHFGLGGLDIYSASKSNGEWSMPANLGQPVNSSGDDFAFSINALNERGYFSSNRAGGYGGDDIYGFIKKGMPLKGQLINASNNQFLSNGKVILSSDHSKQEVSVDAQGRFQFLVDYSKPYSLSAFTEGYKDNLNNDFTTPATDRDMFIQVPMTPNEALELKVIVNQINMGPLSGADVTATANSGEELTGTTNQFGIARISVAPDKNYTVTVSKENTTTGTYTMSSRTVSTNGKRAPWEKILSFDIQYLEAGSTVSIEDIYWDLGSAVLTDRSKIALNQLVALMQNNPNMEVEIGSHTDSRGSDDANMLLSANRARAVVEYIVASGVDGTRLVAAGYGEIQPVNNCTNGVRCSEAQHQQNRRTTFKIISLN